MSFLRPIWDSVNETFIADELHRDPDLVRRAQLTLMLVFVGVVVAGTFSVGTLVQGALLEGTIGVATVLGGAFAPFLLRRTQSVLCVGNYGAGLWFVSLVAQTFGPQGYGLLAVMAMAAVPMVALLLAGWRSGIAWLALTIGHTGLFALAAESGWLLPTTVKGQRPMDYVAPVLFIVVIFGMSGAYEWVKGHALQARTESEHARVSAELAKAQAEGEARLHRANRMASVGQLAAGVAHELNNPLAYVIANLEFVGAQVRNPIPADMDTVNDAVAEAEQGAQRMRRIVRDLTTFARSDEEQVAQVRVSSITSAAINMARNQIKHRARITHHAAPVSVLADDTHLLQVFLNILVNAAHSIPDGHANANEIAVDVRRVGDDVCVTISDTGHGMTPEVLSRVTEPFFTTKPVGEGTGLGLSVCRNIVDGYGGRMEIDSEVGVGTTVRTYFPAAEPSAEGATPEALLTSGVTARRRARVLIIDDDDLVRRSLMRTLRSHEVTSVASGVRGLELIEEGEFFDVILCDIMMPDLTGAEVFERVERDHPETASRFIFLTGGTFTASTNAFLDRVPNEHIRKPFDPSEVRVMVASRVDSRGAQVGQKR